MSLEGLLTLAGLILAMLGIAEPVQRRAIMLFAPKNVLVVGFVGAFVLIEIPVLAKSLGIPISPFCEWIIHLLVFAYPVIPIIIAVYRYQKGEIKHCSMGFAELIEDGLLEDRFAEIRRLLMKSRKYIKNFAHRERDLLFDRRVIHSMVKIRSFVHLEMLSDMQLLDALENRFSIVDTVLREVVAADDSPLREAVLREYGGDETAKYPVQDYDIIEKTLQNPKWYVKTNAHYPLLLLALEHLWSGKLDASYNDLGTHYTARQGTSSRSRCPIYLAEKTHVIAIQKAIEQSYDEDIYVTDLLDLYRNIIKRSVYRKEIWHSEPVDSPFPTPYAYLLNEIASDFFYMAIGCIKSACDTGKDTKTPRQPGEISRQLSVSWRAAIVELARSNGKVSEKFKTDTIKHYLDFILMLRFATDEWAPGELLLQTNLKIDLNLWYSLFTEPWKSCGIDEKSVYDTLRIAFQQLDMSKPWVRHGQDRLQKDIGFLYRTH